MATQLAATTWAAGPSDQLATVDVYKAKAQGVVSSIRDFYKQNQDVFDPLIRGGKAAAEVFPIIQGTIQAFKLNKANLAARILMSNNALGGIISRIKPALKDTMVEGFEEYGDTFMKIGSVVTRIATTDFSRLNDITYLVNDLATQAGNGQLMGVIDQDSLAGFMVGTIKEATQFGVPNSFGTIMNVLEHGPIMNKVMQGCLPDALQASDLRMIGDMARMCSSGNLKDYAPDIFDKVGQMYKRSVRGTEADALREFGEIKETFNSIDELWDKKLRSTDPVPLGDITHLFGANDAMRDVMRTGAMNSSNPDDKMMLLADAFDRMDVVTEVRKQLPASTVQPQGELPQPDPRLLANPLDIRPLEERPWYKNLFPNGLS